MTQQQAIQLFDEKRVRTAWDTDAEKWWFSVVDVVSVLTDSDYQTARKYWKVLKGRLAKEGNQSVTNCYQLKMQSTDGKKYLTDVADTEQLFRLIQSIPSPKAEPFTQWMAQVAAPAAHESAGGGRRSRRRKREKKRELTGGCTAPSLSPLISSLSCLSFPLLLWRLRRPTFEW